MRFFIAHNEMKEILHLQLFVPKTKLNIGKHAFSVTAPTIWNQLPITIRVLGYCTSMPLKFKVATVVEYLIVPEEVEAIHTLYFQTRMGATFLTKPIKLHK